MPGLKLLKIYKFTDDQSDKVIALWEKCGLNRSWNNSEKDIARKNSDKDSKFLIGQIDKVPMTSIVIGYDGHRGSIHYLSADPDFLGASYSKILIAEAEQSLLSVGCPKINFCVRTDNDKVVEFYRQLGYAIESVYLMGKRFIKGD